METRTPFDVALLGGGIVGAATAFALASRKKPPSILLLEAEDRLAAHQTGHNSGVIHSGLYYKPGSLKARLCVEGRAALTAFCRERGIPFEICGKLVVATRPEQVERLDRLEETGRANGLTRLERLGAGEIHEFEPHAAGLAALWVGDTGIVDYKRVTEALAHEVAGKGGRIVTGAALKRLSRSDGTLVLETPAGAFPCQNLVACAGLQADRVARLCGVDPKVRIIPFRGEYYELLAGRRSLVKNVIYPVPDPRFPFLGVHFTRRISGEVEAGPNAVLAFKRQGYSRLSFSSRDTFDTLSFTGFWPFATRHWRTGLGEFHRSFSRAAFVESLRELVPELKDEDVTPGGSGVRAQAMDRAGNLLDDFHFVEGDRMIHVLNAPSPAATASLAIGAHIAERAVRSFCLP